VVVKAAAKWLLRAVLREATGPIGTFLNILDAAIWIYDAYPYIQAYLDPPKPLEELRRAAFEPKRGYDIHHIVEQGPAARDGYPRSMIDAPDNLVRISTLKHWEINAWYGTPNEDYGGLSPRAYLRNKDWAERVRVGHIALIKNRILAP
jgi:hypothetical protein